ncbi:Zinc finger protein 316 [Papilio machaon]|uniref:Zinc finger protein 316 n=1 Tax=Papilio machaon TaxID=76193 RepID=A0A0N1INQ6_PAPMA|nr:Zinc finger protein 316 [Papilio machaon]
MSSKDAKVYVCTQAGCNNKYNRPYRLEQHLLSHLNIKPFPCTWENCCKAYSNKSHLNRHIASVHEKEKKNIIYSCPQCCKTYSNRQNLKKHIRQKHVINLPFVCDCCKAQCRKKHQLSAHMYKHNGVKAFSCEICSKEFVTLYEKKRHMRCHKTYTCDECSSTFNQWSKYQKHRKSEHCAKKYICDECGRAYTQRIHIIRHLKIHSNTENLRRTFACPYSNCFRRYTRNSNLTQHILVKHKKLKHICNICQADYSSQAKLKEHLKIHENGVVPRRKVKSLANGRKHRKDKDTLKVTTALKLAGLTETVLEKCKVFNDTQHE